MDSFGGQVRIQIITPFDMQWVEGYKKVFEGHEVHWTANPVVDDSDVMIFMWMNEDTRSFINIREKRCKYIVFCRRYEIYNIDPKDIQWDKVDKVIFVNDYLAEIFERRTGIKPEVIYNGVDPEKWTYKERGHGNKVAWVGYINKKKNLPLALQIMAVLPRAMNLLPRNMELHIAGDVQCNETMDYLHNLADKLKIRVILSGQVDDMNTWLEDKNYLLSTAISEGCPNSVIEAMAKGIKPIVHNWPGAHQQFGKHVFNTIKEAAYMMVTGSAYKSQRYREIVEGNFGWGQYEKVAEIVTEVECLR